MAAVLQKGITVLTTPIFTRLLSSAEYGRFNVFNSWLNIISVIVTLNLSSGVYTMGIVKFKDEEKIFTSSLQGLTLILCIVWSIFYLLHKDFWNALFKLTTVQMLAMLTMIWASATFTFWMTTQRNQYKYRLLILVTLIVSLFKPLAGIFLVLKAEDKVTARILGLALVEFIFYTPFFFVQISKGKCFFSAKYWKYAILFNLPLIPHYLSNKILSGSDRIMIQRMIGESQAGIYSLAYSLALLMMMVNDAMNKTMSPWLYQRIREKEYDKMSKVVYPSLLCVGICNIFLIAIAPELVLIFAPPEYMEAVYVIVPVALSGFFSYMYLCFAPFEFYFEKRSWTTIGTFVSAAANIVLNLICIRFWGYIAAGYTTLICSALMAYMHMYFMVKVCKTYLDGITPYNNRKLVVMSLLFVIVGMLFIPIYTHPIVRYMIIACFFITGLIKRHELIGYISSVRDSDR